MKIVLITLLLVLQHIVTSVPHQTAATGAQYAVSTKAADAKDPHCYNELRDELGVSQYSVCMHLLTNTL